MKQKVINSNKGFSELLMNYVLTRMGRQASFQPKEKDVFKGMGIAPSHEPQYMPLLDGMFEELKPLVESDASYEELSDALEVWRLKIENLTDRLYRF